MIAFNTIKDALDYRKHCIFCKNKMRLTGASKTSLSLQRYGVEESLELTSVYDTIVINLTYNKVIDFNFKDTSPMLTTVFNGDLYYYPFYIGCGHCGDFNYTIQSTFKTSGFFEKIILGSETLYRSQKDSREKLYNNYSSNTTTISFINDASENPRQPITFPLIDIDHNQVNESFERIKSLIVFS